MSFVDTIRRIVAQNPVLSLVFLICEYVCRVWHVYFRGSRRLVCHSDAWFRSTEVAR